MGRILSFAAFLFVAVVQAQSPWPSVNWNSASNLTAIMNANGVTDLSGLHWNPLTNALYCVQGDGRLRVLQMNGSAAGFTQIANKVLSGGPEGITQVDYSAPEFYTIDENSYEIRKYTHNATFGNLNESRHWNLLQAPSPMQDTGNTGPEGIAFVPDSFLTASGFVSQVTGQQYSSIKGMGGLMFVAHQDGGYIWVFDINHNVNNDFAYVGKYKTNHLESCDLNFDTSTGLLYILHNVDANYLETTNLSSITTTGNTRKFVTHNEFFIPNPLDGNTNIEGFAVMPKCHGDMVWLCRDAESSEDANVKQDVLRWFDPFTTDGVCGELSVGEIENMIRLSVYPNPGKNQVAISMEGNEISDASVMIINSIGQSVLTMEHCSGTAISVDVSPLESGLYIIEIAQGPHITRLKWIKT